MKFGRKNSISALFGNKNKNKKTTAKKKTKKWSKLRHRSHINSKNLVLYITSRCFSTFFCLHPNHVSVKINLYSLNVRSTSTEIVGAYICAPLIAKFNEVLSNLVPWRTTARLSTSTASIPYSSKRFRPIFSVVLIHVILESHQFLHGYFPAIQVEQWEKGTLSSCMLFFREGKINMK